MINKDELAEIRLNLVTEAANGLTKHHKALGAIELVDYLLAQLAKDDEEE